MADYTLRNQYPPGFYGGTYIPNYRRGFKVNFTGKGSWDFEKNYDGLRKENDDDIVKINAIIKSFVKEGKLDAITECFVHYTGFINDNEGGQSNDFRYFLPAFQIYINSAYSLKNGINGYKPKNNKCYLYPYCSLEIVGYGQNQELAYEDFDNVQKGDPRMNFGVTAKFLPGESIMTYPMGYRGQDDNYDYSATGPALPLFSYTADNAMNEYNASRNIRNETQTQAKENRNLADWQTISQGVQSIASNVIMGAIGGGGPGALAGAIAGGVGAAVSTGVGVVGNHLQYNQTLRMMEAELADVVNRPSSVSNQNASAGIPSTMKNGVVPFVVRKSIRLEVLKKLDEFFTRFGYKTNRTGVPNIYKRPNFCFLLCKNAVVGGNIPAEDLNQIKAVLEHGITFWHTTDVGNYSLSNDAATR